MGNKYFGRQVEQWSSKVDTFMINTFEEEDD
jgi:hypothetical protein